MTSLNGATSIHLKKIINYDQNKIVSNWWWWLNGWLCLLPNTQIAKMQSLDLEDLVDDVTIYLNSWHLLVCQCNLSPSTNNSIPSFSFWLTYLVLIDVHHKVLCGSLTSLCWFPNFPNIIIIFIQMIYDTMCQLHKYTIGSFFFICTPNGLLLGNLPSLKLWMNGHFQSLGSSTIKASYGSFIGSSNLYSSLANFFFRVLDVTFNVIWGLTKVESC